MKDGECIEYYIFSFSQILLYNTSQQILRLLDKNMKSYFALLKIWKKNKKSLSGCPQFPKYKKKNGRNLLIFSAQSQIRIRKGYVKLPQKMNVKKIKTKIPDDKNSNHFKLLRIIPKLNYYVVELIYEKEEQINENLDKNKYLSIDLGVNNLASIVTNQNGSFLINGRIVKSINQYYNKTKAKIQSQLKKNHNKNWSKRLSRLETKRNFKLNDYFHKASKYIADFANDNNIKNIVIGKNKGWKNKVNIGKKNNQNFIQIPFQSLINKIKYKAQFVGINVIEQEESYTSICDSLGLEDIKEHIEYIGKRVKRGLFKSSIGKFINADINGALNILRKVVGDDFIKSNSGFVNEPLKTLSL